MEIQETGSFSCFPPQRFCVLANMFSFENDCCPWKYLLRGHQERLMGLAFVQRF